MECSAEVVDGECERLSNSKFQYLKKRIASSKPLVCLSRLYWIYAFIAFFTVLLPDFVDKAARNEDRLSRLDSYKEKRSRVFAILYIRVFAF